MDARTFHDVVQAASNIDKSFARQLALELGEQMIRDRVKAAERRAENQLAHIMRHLTENDRLTKHVNPIEVDSDVTLI